MKRVVLPELLPDMVLVRPVTNANGLPIVAAGTILDAAMIERLRQMELTSVYVEGDALDSGGKTLAELEAELEHRFRQVAQDPIQQLILRTLRTHVRATHGMVSVTEPPQAT
jgi:adenine deaminase